MNTASTYKCAQCKFGPENWQCRVSFWRYPHFLHQYCSSSQVTKEAFSTLLSIHNYYALLHNPGSQHSEKKKAVLIRQMFSDSQKSIAVWKVPRLRPFVLVIITTCGRRRKWSFRGMILRGKFEVLWEKPFPIAMSNYYWYWMQAFAVRGPWLIAWAIARKLKYKFSTTTI